MLDDLPAWMSEEEAASFEEEDIESPQGGVLEALLEIRRGEG